MSHPVHALTLTFLGCPAAAPPRASSSRQRAWGRSRRSWSSNHRGVGDSHHPGLLASRLSALWVEGPTRRSTDLSFRASPAWRAHFLHLWRVEPGTRTAPILGHRVVRVRWYPARFLKFCRRHGGEPHLPATGKTLRSGAGLGLGGVGGGGMPPPVTLAAPAELSQALRIAGASIEPISSVPTSYCQGPSGRVGALAPRFRIARPGVRGHLSHHLISGSS